MVESADYRQYIKNLRAIGCPEETIRDIIIADVNQLFASKAKERIGPKQEFQFWKTNSADYPAGEAERIQKQVELAREKRAILKELLGVDIEDPSPLAEAFNPIRDKYAFLPKEKQQQMMDLEALYAAKMMGMFGRIPNPPPEKDPRYVQLMAEKEAEMARILTPQEMEDYNVRYSRTADSVRRFLGNFDASEEEFRRIFRHQQEFEKNFPASDSANLSREQRDARIAALQETKDHLRLELGEQRFYRKWPPAGQLQKCCRAVFHPKGIALQRPGRDLGFSKPGDWNPLRYVACRRATQAGASQFTPAGGSDIESLARPRGTQSIPR
jgi:hypothetical protein